MTDKFTWVLLADSSKGPLCTDINHLKNSKPLSRSEALKEAYRVIRKKYKGKEYQYTNVPSMKGKTFSFDWFRLQISTIDKDGTCTDLGLFPEYHNKKGTAKLVSFDFQRDILGGLKTWKK